MATNLAQPEAMVWLPARPLMGRDSPWQLEIHKLRAKNAHLVLHELEVHGLQLICSERQTEHGP